MHAATSCTLFLLACITVNFRTASVSGCLKNNQLLWPFPQYRSDMNLSPASSWLLVKENLLASDMLINHIRPKLFCTNHVFSVTCLKVVAYRCVFLQGASHFAVAFCALLNQSNLSSVMPLLDLLKGYSFPFFYSILNTLKHFETL